MDEEVRKVAAAAVVEKAQDLLEKRADTVRQRAEIDRQIRAFDRALFDCRAAGRLFGVDIELPEDVRPGLVIPRIASASSPRIMVAPRAKNQTSLFPEKVPATTAPPPTAPPTLPNVASTTFEPGAEPSIRDLILHYLRIAGAAGEKAAVLRRRVETFLNRQIHYKTIGMSLYRLSKETPPVVSRAGQTWYLANPWGGEAKDPGARTPGS